MGGSGTASLSALLLYFIHFAIKIILFLWMYRDVEHINCQQIFFNVNNDF